MNTQSELSRKNLVEALGGAKTLGKKIRKNEDLEDQIRKGLPFAALEHLSNILALQLEKISHLLGITTRTLQRRRSENILAKEESAQLVRIARIYQRASEILGSHEDAVAWLREPNIALAGKSPLDDMDTPLGEERVHELLSRIEFGVYS